MNTTQSVMNLVEGLRNPVIFQSFQTNPSVVSAQYGVELNHSFLSMIQNHLKDCHSFDDAQLKGERGFRFNDPNPTPDGWGGKGGGIACPGDYMPQTDNGVFSRD